jgi:hypothetical protein
VHYSYGVKLVAYECDGAGSESERVDAVAELERETEEEALRLGDWLWYEVRCRRASQLLLSRGATAANGVAIADRGSVRGAVCGSVNRSDLVEALTC